MTAQQIRVHNQTKHWSWHDWGSFVRRFNNSHPGMLQYPKPSAPTKDHFKSAEMVEKCSAKSRAQKTVVGRTVYYADLEQSVVLDVVVAAKVQEYGNYYAVDSDLRKYDFINIRLFKQRAEEFLLELKLRAKNKELAN